MMIDVRSNLLLFGLSGIPVGRSLLLSGKKWHEVLLVENALVCATPGLAGLFQLGDLWGLLSDLTGLREGAVLLAHNKTNDYKYSILILIFEPSTIQISTRKRPALPAPR